MQVTPARNVKQYGLCFSKSPPRVPPEAIHSSMASPRRWPQAYRNKTGLPAMTWKCLADGYVGS